MKKSFYFYTIYILNIFIVLVSLISILFKSLYLLIIIGIIALVQVFLLLFLKKYTIKKDFNDLYGIKNINEKDLLSVINNYVDNYNSTKKIKHVAKNGNVDFDKAKEIIILKDDYRDLILSQVFSENKVKTLYEISKLIIDIEDLNKLLDSILEKIANFFGAKSGSIILWDNKREELIINNVYNLDHKFIGSTISIGDGISGYVAFTGEPLIIRKDSKNLKFNIDRKDITDSIIFPIFYHKDLIGIISLNDTPLIKIMKDEEVINLMSSFANQTAIIILNNNLIKKLKNIYKSTIKTLVYAIDAKDPYTAGHSERVTYYSLEIGKKINLDTQSLERLEFAAILHDVGKIGIPEDILAKPTKLDKEEYEIIKNHPKLSYKIVKPIELPWDISDDVLSHHERWDGKGYPNGKKEENISLYSRIIAIADAFDAMISDRPYRRGLTINEAIDEISKNIGQQFDPNLSLLFISMIRNNELKFN